MRRARPDVPLGSPRFARDDGRPSAPTLAVKRRFHLSPPAALKAAAAGWRSSIGRWVLIFVSGSSGFFKASEELAPSFQSRTLGRDPSDLGGRGA